MRQVTVTLLGKPGCHLCEDARAVIQDVLADFEGDAVRLQERSILDDPELADRYGEKIPVVLVDGREHAYWRVDAAQLRGALTGPRG